MFYRIREMATWFRLKYIQYVRNGGIHPYEVWNLDTYMAKYVLPRLKLYRKNPNGLSSKFIEECVGVEAFSNDDYVFAEIQEKWNQALDKMIFSLQMVADDSFFDILSDPKLMEDYDEGIRLFSEYWTSLWS